MATVDRDLPLEKYTLVSNAILRDKTISANTFRVHCYLASLSPKTSTNRYRIAAGLGMSSGTVQKSLVTLEKAGYFERRDFRNENGTLGEPVWKLYNAKPAQEPVSKKRTQVPVSNSPVSENCTPAPI